MEEQLRGITHEVRLWHSMHQRNRHHCIGENKLVRCRTKRDLVEKNNDIDENQPPGNPGHASSGARIIFDRDHSVMGLLMLCSPATTNFSILRYLENHGGILLDTLF